MRKLKRDEYSVALKLQNYKTARSIPDNRPCPNCYGYQSVGSGYLYYCSVLGIDRPEYAGGGYSYPIVAKVPCSIRDARHCELLKLFGCRDAVTPKNSRA